MLLFLNINGSLRFLSCSALQHIDQTWPGSKCQTLTTLYVLSCAAYGGSDWFLMSHLHTVVFASRNGCNNNRSDSDVSHSDTLCFSSSKLGVRHSSILHAHCSLTLLQVILAGQTNPTSQRIVAWYRALKIRPSYTYLRTDWR